MTEEERPQLEHTHGEYRDEEDAEGDYNEYDENEEEYYEGEDGGEDEEGANAQVGEEIALVSFFLLQILLPCNFIILTVVHLITTDTRGSLGR